MKTKSEEIEIKFYLTNLNDFRLRLESVGAVLKIPRTHEVNWRFDDSNGNLQSSDQVLRLRKDDHVYLTYKGSGVLKGGASARKEYELMVSDFEEAEKFLEALGYRAYMVYEKYRTTFEFMGCELVLDEMPYGWFCEIEADHPVKIRRAAEKLSLKWDARIVVSYMKIFTNCVKSLGLSIKDLTFDNFENLKPAPGDLGVKPADR